MNFLCTTTICVQMFTGVGIPYAHNSDSYLSNGARGAVYCQRSSYRYSCEYLERASSNAASGARPVNSGRLD